MIASLILAARLCGALVGPEVDTRTACEAALPIVVASDEYHPAFIGAIALGETGGTLNPSALSPDGRDCGPMQVRTSLPARCRRLRSDLWYAYAAGVQRLRDAREFCGWHHDATLACAVAGYQGGVPGVRSHWRGSSLRARKRRELLDLAGDVARRGGWLPLPASWAAAREGRQT